MAFIQKANDGTSASVASFAVTMGSNTTAGNTLIAAVRYGDNNTRTCLLTDTQGNTWVQMRSIYNATGGGKLELWYAANIVGGACTITMTPSSATAGQVLLVAEYSGLISAVPNDGESYWDGTPTGGTDAVTSGTWTVPQAGDMIVGICANYQAVASYPTITAGTGFTIRAQDDASNTYGLVTLEDNLSGYPSGVAAGTVSATFTYATNFPSSTVIGGAFRTQAPGIVARNFPGDPNSASHYLSIPASNLWNISNNLCFASVVYVRDYLPGTYLVALGTAATRGLYFGMAHAGTGALNAGRPGSGGFAQSALVIPKYTWCVVVCNAIHLGASQFRLYNLSTDVMSTENTADGSALVAPSNDGGNIVQYMTTPAAGNVFDGMIQRTMIMQGLPTDAEIAAWGKRGTLPSSVTVKGAWDLRGNSPERDLTGNGNHLTVFGTGTGQGFGGNNSIMMMSGVGG